MAPSPLPLRRELFDLKADKGENRNLAVARPEDVKRLSSRLDAWRKEVGAKMPRANPDYDQNRHQPGSR